MSERVDGHVIEVGRIRWLERCGHELYKRRVQKAGQVVILCVLLLLLYLPVRVHCDNKVNTMNER